MAVPLKFPHGCGDGIGPGGEIMEIRCGRFLPPAGRNRIALDKQRLGGDDDRHGHNLGKWA